MRFVQERRAVAPLRTRATIRGAAIAATAVVGVDQLAKALVVANVGSTDQVKLFLGVRIVRVSNRGVAFSLGNSRGSGGVVVLVVAIVAVLAWFLRRELRRPSDDPRAPSLGQAVAFGAIFGGAIGNMIDRLVRHPGWGRGAVVDFVDVVRFWPVFNVADAALTVGCLALVATTIRRGEPR